MRYRHARDLFDYWQDCPPEHESLAILLRAQTSWEPQSVASMTEEEVQEANRLSIEKRWATGQALSPKQMVEAFGGGSVGISSDGVYRGADGRQIPGSHKFPGMDS